MDSPLWGVIQADPIVKGWLNMLRQVETEMTQNNATQS